MALATLSIGFIPGYRTIGITAPLLLLLVRLVQGFSTGGEYAGAMTFIAESTPDKTRGIMSSGLEVGTFIVRRSVLEEKKTNIPCKHKPFMMQITCHLERKITY